MTVRVRESNHAVVKKVVAFAQVKIKGDVRVKA